jgi:predicted nucleic acid-binding protein
LIVVDASVWATGLADPGEVGGRCRQELYADPDWIGPAHLPTEVLRTLRRLEVAGRLSTEDASTLAADVASTQLRILGPEPWLLAAQWALRHNVSAYDAPYVVIAQRVAAHLITADARLARAATALGVQVRLIQF